MCLCLLILNHVIQTWRRDCWFSRSQIINNQSFLFCLLFWTPRLCRRAQLLQLYSGWPLPLEIPGNYWDGIWLVEKLLEKQNTHGKKKLDVRSCKFKWFSEKSTMKRIENENVKWLKLQNLLKRKGLLSLA